MTPRNAPARDVPTLTEVVPPTALPAPVLIDPAVTAALSAQTQELRVQRVLQRTDLIIEQRLHEAIESLILVHTQAMMPRLREAIEQVVRESVSQAFEQECSLPADFSENPPVHPG